uniref:Uncharacterized protein n=1 Tax=Cuerna arida TaxID=1464854 RepID=A0A1B6GST4_9HEMI
MAAPKLIKLSMPIVGQVRHQTGVCGIEPFKPDPPPPFPAPKKFPEHLLRPPCLPGGGTGRFPPDCFTFKGYYCPPERIKYIYPPFSENIDFVPSGEVECWWARPRNCEFDNMDENLPIRI